MAERTALSGYIVYTCIITSFIYPVVVHWGWSTTGWASFFNTVDSMNNGLQDFAGSGIVHMTGGIAALVGAYMVGPRIGRFDGGKPVSMPGHSATLQVMGTLILWLGWYGFNPGSTLGLSATGYARDAARITVTTTISAAAGGVTVCLLEKFLGDKTWSVSAVCNGILAGLVSITSGCSVTYPWSAMVIGWLGGFVYFGSSKLVLKVLKVDDPLDAFAVHGACGFWGVFATGLFSAPGYAYGSGKGAFYGSGAALATALSFLFATIAWVGGTSFIMFFCLKKLNILRVSFEVERAGMDTSKHGGSAYPASEESASCLFEVRD
jgi:Amt family ammonium transporter